MTYLLSERPDNSLALAPKTNHLIVRDIASVHVTVVEVLETLIASEQQDTESNTPTSAKPGL